MTETNEQERETLRDELTEIEQRLTPTDPELIERGLAGDPDAIRTVRRRREAIEHILLARHCLREVDDAR